MQRFIFFVICLYAVICLFSCKNNPSRQQQNSNNIGDIILSGDETSDGIFFSGETNNSISNGIFEVPELQIKSSPENACRYIFPADETIADYTVSPDGSNVAFISIKEGKSYIKFWEIGDSQLSSDSYTFSENIELKNIAWHPLASSLFVTGHADDKWNIYKLEKEISGWISKSIFSSSLELNRLVVCPCPFETGERNHYDYRLFFGMDNGDKTFRIVSVTTHGNTFYQVVGPAKTFSYMDEDFPPSRMEASFALPVAFHPAGHQLIWENQQGKRFVSTYVSSLWANEVNNLTIKCNGDIMPTPNGLGFICWQRDKKGIDLLLLANQSKETQLFDYQFERMPSVTPDEKGVIGITKQNDAFVLNYVPVKIPFAAVSNAWMYICSEEEFNLFQKNYGLFRPNQGEQLYQLYDTESYYDRSSPTRPYLVTTDIFWEIFGAAYQGVFIVSEQDEAMPNFWDFTTKAGEYFNSKNPSSKWCKVFNAIKDFRANNTQNKEVENIVNEVGRVSEVTGKDFAYSELKPRGHYTSSPERTAYFKAFKYFTTILKEDKESIKELETLPSSITKYTENWINSYAGFIAPGRSPLIWKNLNRKAPAYCRYPENTYVIFPLSWGFDNEIFYGTVYHENVPAELQIIDDEGGFRLLPSGIDMAAVMGNNFAEKLLAPDYEKYPPLRKVITNLKGYFKTNQNTPDFKDNIYNQWLNALSVQWIDSVSSPNGAKDYDIWQTKRLQTGLASWATLRHATVLVNERSAAEAGEGGFEDILMRAPRGFVEPDPNSFEAIAVLFDKMSAFVSKDILKDTEEKRTLYNGIVERLKETAKEARLFKAMAEKEKRGEILTDEENEKILYTARVAEHLFLIFNSLSNKDFGLANPDPMPKIADVAGDGDYLMAAVGNPMEWNLIVPFFGRKQIVKGAVYSYYEFQSAELLNDEKWREMVTRQEFPSWIKPYVTRRSTGMAETGY